MSSTFFDICFPEDLVLFRNSAIEFFTIVQKAKNGSETRVALNALGRSKYEAENVLLTKSNAHRLATFFRIVMGMGYSFRFKDSFDFSAKDQILEVVDKNAALRKTYQFLEKKYDRMITKPVQSSIVIMGEDRSILEDGVDYIPNYATGMIRFSNETDRKKVLASFEFDTEVRFGQDELSFVQERYERIVLPKISLIEVI